MGKKHDEEDSMASKRQDEKNMPKTKEKKEVKCERSDDYVET